MTDGYTYVVVVDTPACDAICGTRHEAVGEKAILDAIAPDGAHEIRVRRRFATDPV